ncbi:MAG: sugar phosphate isomerase/epimerase [Acidobacteria bacterium]|nr:sugar phosphate isomerase/epimerase [Acidobacteriota bacterium]
MRLLTRRTFTASAIALAPGLTAKPVLPAVGVQLYTVRGVLPKDAAGTLQSIEEIGFREVEATYANLDQIWTPLTATKLKPVSLHLDTPMFLHKTADLPAAVDNAAKRGFKYAVCPYIAPADRGGVPVIQKLAANLNKAGELCRKAGLTLCYHNHAFEFEKADGNRTLLDVLLAESDPKLVQLEMDVMWVTVTGADPVALLKKYKNRVPLMHLKDLHKGVPPRLDEKIPRDAFAEVGRGVVNFPAVLKAAKSAGVKHYFVEQDQTPGDPLASLRQSFAYLQTLHA